MKHFKIIILLGRPGSGKGTQAKLLVKKFGLEYIGSGDLLRARKEEKDFTGIKIGKVIDTGKRVSTPVIFKLWMDKLEEFKKKSKLKGFVLDGSPRTLNEVETLEQTLEWYEWLRFKKVIYVNISPKEAMQRLTKRRMCKHCGRIIPFIGEYKKIKKCDKCKGQLVVRADDTILGIKKRLAWYEADVSPAINYYKKQGKLIKINGEQPIEVIHKDILKRIKH